MRVRKVIRVFEALVSQPEEVEADFVAAEDLFVGIGTPASLGSFRGPRCLAVVAVFGAVALDEFVEVGAGHPLGLEREVLVRSEVVDPDGFRPRFRRARLAVEEEDVRLHALRVEDAGGEAEQRVDLALLEQVPAHGLAGAPFEEHVVGDDDGGAAVDRQQRLHVLDEVELLVGRRRPEVGAVVRQCLAVGVAFLIDDGDRRLLAEWRIGDDDVRARGRLIAQRVVDGDRRFVVVSAVGSDAVKEEVHAAEAGDVRDQFHAAQRLEAEVALLIAIELEVVLEVFVRGEEEAAGAAGGIGDDLFRLRADAVDDGVDEHARREVLPRAPLHILRIALEQTLVGIAFHVGAHRHPCFLVDEVHDQPPQLGRVLEFVLRFVEDQPEQTLLVAQRLKGVAVVIEQLVAVFLDEARPTVLLRHRALLVIRRLSALVGHFEEQQIGELFDVVAVRHTVVAQDVAVVPEFLDDGGCIHFMLRNAFARPTLGPAD